LEYPLLLYAGEMMDDYTVLLILIISVITITAALGIYLFTPPQSSTKSYGMKCEKCGATMYLVSGIWICDSCGVKYDQDGKQLN
jgi:hypothetical protein